VAHGHDIDNFLSIGRSQAPRGISAVCLPLNLFSAGTHGLLTNEHLLDQPDTASAGARGGAAPHRLPTPNYRRSVVGGRDRRRDFDIDVVAEAASIEVEAELEAIDTAVAAGLVAENEQQLVVRLTHSLVSKALYETAGRLRRVRRYRKIGAAAARIWAGHDKRAAQIARHWLLAAELHLDTAAQACTHAAPRPASRYPVGDTAHFGDKP
jgi:hypothetical protein